MSVGIRSCTSIFISSILHLEWFIVSTVASGTCAFELFSFDHTRNGFLRACARWLATYI